MTEVAEVYTASQLKKEAGIQIPNFAVPIVSNNLERIYVGVRFWLLRFFLIWKYFGHPFKSVEAIGKLVEVRRKYLGEYKISKIIKVDGSYYFALNGPGIFSKGFARNYLGELNRIYKKKPQTELRVILMAITKKCGYKCEHCFEWDSLNGEETLSEESVFKIIERFQERGVGQIQFGGGEPLSRINTIEKVLKKYSENSDFAIVTSGFQLTREKAFRLKHSGLTSVTISLDHHTAEGHDNFRGFEGAFDWVIKAVKNAKEVNLVVNLSLCATKAFVNKENLEAYADLARQIGIAFIWIIEPRAVGHYQGIDVALSYDQLQLLKSFYERMNFDTTYRNYPAVAYPDYHQRRVGCHGSGNRFLYINPDGQIKSCPMCGSAHGSAETVDIDEAIKSMKASGCSKFSDALD